MATVALKDVKKIYPMIHESKREKKKREKAGIAEKKTSLQITDKGVLAVKDFNLEIKDKEFVVFVGPSGCGKSTTLRMIAGLEEISGGELYIDGKLMNDVSPKDRDIAMVFQSYALYPHMTVYDNMAFALKLKKLPKDVIKQKVEEAAEILDITQFLKRKPKNLSGGQRQRVAIGRAIVREPKVLLMDEPLSNLDAKLRNQMRAEIIKLRKKINTTFVYVTHDQTEAMTLGDRIVVMKDGLIQQIGKPQDVFFHPANLFVAGFIGTPQMNVFRDAYLHIDNGEYSVEIKGKKFVLSGIQQNSLKMNNCKEGPVIAGIRPVHIDIEDNGVEGILEVSELMGNEVHLHVNVDGNDIVIVAATTSINSDKVSVGKPISFRMDPALIHLFDPITEKNLI